MSRPRPEVAEMSSHTIQVLQNHVYYCTLLVCCRLRRRKAVTTPCHGMENVPVYIGILWRNTTGDDLHLVVSGAIVVAPMEMSRPVTSTSAVYIYHVQACVEKNGGRLSNQFLAFKIMCFDCNSTSSL